MITNKTHWIKKKKNTSPRNYFSNYTGNVAYEVLVPADGAVVQHLKPCPPGSAVCNRNWTWAHTEPHTRTKRSIEWRVKGSSSDANENWVHVKQAAGAYCHCDSLGGQWIWMTDYNNLPAFQSRRCYSVYAWRRNLSSAQCNLKHLWCVCTYWQTFNLFFHTKLKILTLSVLCFVLIPGGWMLLRGAVHLFRPLPPPTHFSLSHTHTYTHTTHKHRKQTGRLAAFSLQPALLGAAVTSSIPCLSPAWE